MKLRPFELALVIAFGVIGVASLIILATADTSNDSAEGDEGYVGPVQIWGTLPSAPIDAALSTIAGEDENYANVQYRFVPPNEFDQTLLEALADGTGPDIILASHEVLVEQRRRIIPNSYEAVPRRDFLDTFLDGANVFTLSDGIYGRPLLVDPLVMYWNRDILTNNGFLAAPKTWEELVNIQLPGLVQRTFDRSITRSVVAMGVYPNTQNGYGLLSALLIQGGSAMVSEETVDSDRIQYTVGLNAPANGSNEPLYEGLSFYLRFGQPANTLYSWNRSFSSDRSEFISEDLVFYFGYASEAPELQRLNPNFNFDIAEIPQGAGATVRRTYGQHYALFVMRSADNLSGVYPVLRALSTDAILNQLAQSLSMVPARRALVAQGSNDVYGRIAYRAAPVAYGWLNPNRVAVDAIFADMVSDVNENRTNVTTAANVAENKLRQLYE